MPGEIFFLASVFWLPTLTSGFFLMTLAATDGYRRAVAAFSMLTLLSVWPVRSLADVQTGVSYVLVLLVVGPVLLQWLSCSIILAHDAGDQAVEGRPVAASGLGASVSRVLLLIASAAALAIALVEVSDWIRGTVSGVRPFHLVHTYASWVAPVYLVFCMLTALNRVPRERLLRWGVGMHLLALPALYLYIVIALLWGCSYLSLTGKRATPRVG